MNIDKLWENYLNNKNSRTREQIILNYAGLVKTHAYKIYQSLPSMVEVDDLISYGTFGLIDAIDKFDPDKNVIFEIYASLRIRGAIYDGLRKMDWAPQSLRRKAKKMEKAYETLLKEYGREPEEEEIASYLEMDVDTYQKHLNDAASLTIYSLENALESGNEDTYILKDFLADEKEPGPQAVVERNELKSLLMEKLKELNEKEKLVISLIYFEELTTKEVAKVLELSEGRISQIHKKAILKLKGALNYYMDQGR